MAGWSRGATRGDGMQLLRADLVTRLGRLEGAVTTRGPSAGGAQAAAIVAIAAEHDLPGVRRLAEGLRSALAAGRRGAAIRPWIEQLRDALDSDARDEQSADAWVASVMVRLAH